MFGTMRAGSPRRLVSSPGDIVVGSVARSRSTRLHIPAPDAGPVPASRDRPRESPPTWPGVAPTELAPTGHGATRHRTGSLALRRPGIDGQAPTQNPCARGELQGQGLPGDTVSRLGCDAGVGDSGVPLQAHGLDPFARAGELDMLTARGVGFGQGRGGGATVGGGQFEGEGVDGSRVFHGVVSRPNPRALGGYGGGGQKGA